MLLWSIVALNLWTWLVRGSDVTIYSEPNWSGDKTELNLGDSSSYIPHPIQSVQIHDGYVLRVFPNQNDLINSWVIMYYDIDADESNLSQLLFIIQAFKVDIEENNQRPDLDWIWIYQGLNYTGMKLSARRMTRKYEWNAPNASIMLGENVGVITYTEGDGYGIPINYVSDAISIKPLKSFFVDLKEYLPTQELIEGHVWLFGRPNYEGDRTSIPLYSNISDISLQTGIYAPLSIQIPPGSIVICYEVADFQGPMTVWDGNMTNFGALSLDIYSLKVVPSNEWPKQDYSIPYVEVILPFSDIYPRNVLPWRLPIGSESNGHQILRQIKSITIPIGLALIAYQGTLGNGYEVWLNSTVLEENSSFRRYKVVHEDDVIDWLDSDPKPNQVFIYAWKNYMNEHLVVDVNRDMSYWYFLYPYFGKESQQLSSLKIPPGLKLIVYTLPYFNGYLHEYTENTPSISHPIESLRVVSVNDTSFKGRSDDSLVVVVQYLYHRQDIIPVDTELMHLPFEMNGNIAYFMIPNGYQVIGYTRPFFMGLNFSYTAATKYDSNLELSTVRIRSLRIIKETTSSMLTQYSPLKKIYTYVPVENNVAAYYVGDADPCVQPRVFLNTAEIEQNTTIKVLFYVECFYQGTYYVGNKFLHKMYKSYRILDATDNIDTAYTDYVALYGTWSNFDHQTLSFRMNDEMPVLYSPWEANIKYIKMSTDVLVVAFSDSNYTGDCKWWTHSNATSGDGKILINDSTWQLRSFKVLNRTEWRGPQTCMEKPKTDVLRTNHPTTASRVSLVASTSENESDQSDASDSHTSSVPAVATTTPTSLFLVVAQDVGSTSVPSTKSVKTSISPQSTQHPTTDPAHNENSYIQTTSMPSTLQQKQSKSLLEQWYSWIVLAVITTFAVVVVVKHRREDRNKTTPPPT